MGDGWWVVRGGARVDQKNIKIRVETEQTRIRKIVTLSIIKTLVNRRNY